MLEGDIGGNAGSMPGGLLAPMGSTSYLAALHAIANTGFNTPLPPSGPSFSPTTMADIVRALAGPAPSPLSYQPTGNAPQLSDYFSSQPYDQAINSVNAGETQGVNTTNAAYNAAIAQAAQQGHAANSAAAQYVAQAKQAAGAAGAQENAYMNTALQGAAPGGLAADQLAGQRALLAQNNQRETQNAQFLQHLTGSDNAAFAQDLASSKAGALSFLNSQVHGEINKILAQKASDQTKAQELYQQQLNAFNNNNANGAAAVAKQNLASQSAYQTAVQNAAKQAMGFSQQLGASPHQSLMQTLQGPNMLEPQVTNAFQSVLYGSPTAQPGALMYGSASGQPIRQQQRLQALSRLDPSIASAVKDMIDQWNNNTKQAASPQAIENYLASLTGGQ